jgi:RimJ/RimL family protein N-acetyltransferase
MLVMVFDCLGKCSIYSIPMNFPSNTETLLSHKTGKEYALVLADQVTFGPNAAKQIASICSQAEVYKIFEALFKGRPYAEKDAEFFINHVQAGWKNRTNFHWMVFDDEEIVGTVGIKSVDGEIGYWQSNRHPGVMSFAVKKLCDFAKAAGMPSLWAYVRRDNIASIRVLERAGFELDEALTAKREDALGYRKLL